MTLKDFEEYIDAVIHDRGLDYFHEENVDNLEKIATGIWRAQVYGTETYKNRPAMMQVLEKKFPDKIQSK